MDKSKEILDCLKNAHVGSENAVSSRELEQRFSMNGRSIRRIIHGLRQKGCPICSEKKGYYYAATQSEVNGTVSRLNEFVNGVSNASTGLLSARVEPKKIQITFTITLDENVAKELGIRTIPTTGHLA